MTTKISGTGFDSLTVDELVLSTPLAEQYGGSGSTGVYKMEYATPKSATGTFVDFDGIPSWAKRITVMFYGVSNNGSSIVQIQIGSTTFTTSGYSSHSTAIESTTAGTTAGGNGFILDAGGSASFVRFGQIVITLVGSNQYVYSSVLGVSGATGARTHYSGGASQALSGNLDRIRITTVNGTDLFDAGTINVMWEGFA